MDLIRADQLLTRRGLARSRSQAADLIRRGMVLSAGKPVSKPGTMVPRSAQLTVIPQGPAFVSRGGIKLDHALEYFGIDPRGMTVLDCGASTGGFTDCLLQRNAEKIYAVDVGYGQLDWNLRNDDRVVVMERTNLRTVPLDSFPEPFHLVTLDMSFISLRLIIPRVMDLLSDNGRVLAMIKPQFEAGRKSVGAGGVVRDPGIHRRVLTEFTDFVIEHHWGVHGLTPSPITGPKGNREFFLYIRFDSGYNPMELKPMIMEAVTVEKETAP